MVTSDVEHEHEILHGRFDLGRDSGWTAVTGDAWFPAVDLASSRRAWIFQRPTRALEPQEVRALEGLAAIRHVAVPLAHAGAGEIPAWVAYDCQDDEPAVEAFAAGPMTIAETLSLGRELCAAITVLEDERRAVPALTPDHLLLRRGEADDVKVSLLGVGLAWPVAPVEESAQVQSVAALVFQALTTQAPRPGHVPRLTDARPELESQIWLESKLRRALGAESPPLGSLAELHAALQGVTRSRQRVHATTSPGAPRVQSATIDVADLALERPAASEPARREHRRWLWPLVVGALLIGAGVTIAMIGPTGSSPEQDPPSLAEPSSEPSTASPTTPSPTMPSAGSESSEERASEPTAAPATPASAEARADDTPAAPEPSPTKEAEPAAIEPSPAATTPAATAPDQPPTAPPKKAAMKPRPRKPPTPPTKPVAPEKLDSEGFILER